MTVKVFTYDDPTTIFENQKLELNHTIHVSATANMNRAITKKIYRDKIKSVAFNMNQFNKLILDSWFNEETVLEQYLDLTAYLDNYNHSSQTIIDSYKRNKNDLLDTLRLFYFLDVELESLNDILTADNFSDKESLLPEIYQWFYELQESKSNLKISIESANDLVRKIQKKAEIQFDQKPTIIFHGFYFITPEQQVVMEIVQSLGIDIIFLNYHKAAFPRTFSFINKFINEEYGWPTYKEWEQLSVKESTHLGDVFSSIFEGNKINQKELLQIKRYEFNNFTDFLSYVEGNDFIEKEPSKSRRNMMMTTNSEYMNIRMQEFYPEYYKSNRNFLKYPIGYLLVQLHEMWNQETKTIEADKDQVLKILSTQFFFKDSEEIYLLNAYEDLSLFFSLCQTKGEWEAQFDKLLNIRLLIEENFYHAKSGQDKFTSDFKLDFNESPFSYLPYLSVSSTNIEKIRQKVQAIFIEAEELFSEETSDINLKKHFERLLSIVDDSQENPLITDGQDDDILSELRKKLNTSTNINEVNKDYLYEAIQFYLSGSANTDNEDLVEALIGIDSELFEDRKIHITGLDERGLPYGEYALPWPLSNKLVEKLSVHSRYIKLLLSRNESTKEMTRYLLHLMFKQADKIELSHLKNYQEHHNLKTSFYLDLMKDYIELDPLKDDCLDEADQVTKNENHSYDISDYSLDKKAEFAYYPNRLLYSKAAKQTNYDSTFQQQFILSRLATYLRITNPHNTELVKEFLFDLFPHMDRFLIELKFEESKEFVGPSMGTYKKKDVVSDYRKQFLYPTIKWSKHDKSIDAFYEQAEKISIVYDSNFYNQELINPYIYPYVDYEYPSDLSENMEEDMNE